MPSELFSQPKPSLWERLLAPGDSESYRIARFLILRFLGLLYFVGFLTLVDQGLPLLGAGGLTPAHDYLAGVEASLGSRSEGFWRLPSLFWLQVSDAYILRVGWLGTLVSLAVLAGYANALMMAFLWFLYLSVVHVGQIWYAFGWEIQLLETGFLAIFLCPLLDGRPFRSRPPPAVVIWLYRWLIFRIMLGAGLIKLRGDPCWRDLTCLLYHFETQPVPNPLSPVLHFMPAWLLKLGVLVNHFCELVVPFFVFGPRRLRYVAGLLLIGFQLFLIASGNLSFLNWLTIVPAIACFDDGFFGRILPEGFREHLTRLTQVPLHGAQKAASLLLLAVVAFGSIAPIVNLLSPRQVMNTSFSPLHLVNTYGAFGRVGRVRYELVFEGRAEGETTWREYELKCKPTNVRRRPCLITPYHYRLDWLLWFAAMGRIEQYPWAAHLVFKLLQDDEGALSLLDTNPFPGAPPKEIRIDLYRYAFAPLGDEAWWRRERVGSWLDPVSLSSRRLRELLRVRGWGGR